MRIKLSNRPCRADGRSLLSRAGSRRASAQASIGSAAEEARACIPQAEANRWACKAFCEYASLPPAKAAEVVAYLIANAADARGAGNKFLTGLTAAATPLRIAETPYWLRKHRMIQPDVWTRPSVCGKANCQACH